MQGMEVEVMYPNTLEMGDVQITEMMKEYSMQSRLLNVGKVNYEYHHMGEDLDN